MNKNPPLLSLPLQTSSPIYVIIIPLSHAEVYIKTIYEIKVDQQTENHIICLIYCNKIQAFKILMALKIYITQFI